jgi:copper(I)-binding protein
VNRALRAATIGVLLISPVAVSACSAGQIPQTSTQNRDKVGPMDSVGPIELREIKIAWPQDGTYAKGDDAELGMAVVNTGEQADQLVSVSGDAFTGVRLSGTGTSPLSSSSSSSSSLSSAPGTPVGTVPPGGAPSTTTTAGGSASSTAATSSATGTAAATTSATVPAGPTTAATGIAGATGTPTSTLPSTSGEAAGGTSVSLPVPADASLFLGENSPHLFLTGLTRSLTPGQSIQVQLTFQRAGAVTVTALVSGPTSYVPNPSTYDFGEPGPNVRGGQD